MIRRYISMVETLSRACGVRGLDHALLSRRDMDIADAYAEPALGSAEPRTGTPAARAAATARDL